MWQEIKRMNEERGQKLQELKALVKKAKDEKRSLTAEEDASFKALNKEIEGLADQVGRLKQVYDEERRLGDAMNEPASDGSRPGRGRLLEEGGVAEVRMIPQGEARLLSPKQRLSSFHREGDPLKPEERKQLDLGRYMRGLLVGKWDGAELERRVMNTAVLAEGGYAVPETLSRQIIDVARNKSVLVNAGALTADMPTKKVTHARITGDVTPAARLENAAFPFSDMTLEAVELDAKSFGVILPVSIELLEDASDLTDLMLNALGQAMAVGIDAACILGDGVAPNILGLVNTTGIQTIATVGQLASYAPFSQAVQKVAEQNGQAGSVVMAPRTFGELDRLEDTSGQPLEPPKSWMALKQLVSNQIPINQGAGENESLAIVGDFSQAIIGVRGGLRIEASRLGAAEADGGSSPFTHGQVWIRAYWRGDFMLRRPKHFCVLEGITPAA